MRTDSAVPVCSLFVFAHPDDEFGCYESIRREIAGGKRVVCFYLTDGGYGGQSIVRRNDESTCVLSKLGVNRSDIHFIGAELGVKDGALHERLLESAHALAQLVGRCGAIDDVYVPAWEGGHQDHDSAHVVAMAMCGKMRLAAHVWQYSLYHGSGLPGPFFHVLKPIPSNGECVSQRLSMVDRVRYLGFCLSYPSQWKTWLGLFPFVFFRLMFGGRYCVQKADPARMHDRPHDGYLLYERRCGITYDSLSERFALFRKTYDTDRA